MEKICSWMWKPTPKSKRQEDSFWWNEEDGFVYLSRDGGEPEKTFEGAWMLDGLQQKPYDKLMPNMKKAHDFLQDKLS